MLASVAVVTGIMMRSSTEQLHEKSELTRKIGSFYEDIRVESRWSLLYTPIFIVRRILFCIFVLTLESYPLAQVILLILSTAFYIIYLFLARPFENSGSNRMTLINECFVLVVCFCLLGFVDDICCDSDYTQYYLGWFVIAWLNLICAINMIRGAINTGKEIRAKMRGCCNRKSTTQVDAIPLNDSEAKSLEGDISKAPLEVGIQSSSSQGDGCDKDKKDPVMEIE